MAEFEEIAERIAGADALLIGAGNGLSITEGLHLFADNRAFEELFGDLKYRYGISCILDGMLARWPSEEEYWGFWSRLIRHYCIGYSLSACMRDLRAISGGKDCFVLTTNGECHFEMTGFAPENIYEVEGTWLAMQCSRGCHGALYPCGELAGKMAALEKDGCVPSELLPVCPHCGAPCACTCRQETPL